MAIIGPDKASYAGVSRWLSHAVISFTSRSPTADVVHNADAKRQINFDFRRWLSPQTNARRQEFRARQLENGAKVDPRYGNFPAALTLDNKWPFARPMVPSSALIARQIWFSSLRKSLALAAIAAIARKSFIAFSG